jgi:hypothetical protein
MASQSQGRLINTHDKIALPGRREAGLVRVKLFSSASI